MRKRYSVVVGGQDLGPALRHTLPAPPLPDLHQLALMWLPRQQALVWSLWMLQWTNTASRKWARCGGRGLCCALGVGADGFAVQCSAVLSASLPVERGRALLVAAESSSSPFLWTGAVTCLCRC